MQILFVFTAGLFTLIPQSFAFSLLPASSASPSITSSFSLHGRRWDSLEIEPDEEPQWYLLNCVATTELQLLAQLQETFAYLSDMKFVVPTSRHTRSHGANRIVTETKVKYPGYVFAHLQLVPDVYEQIQDLDLCRSWMGTINLKGHKKLPQKPLPLNEMEIEKFGLEDIEETNAIEMETSAAMKLDAKGILLDDGEDEEEGVDKGDLKQYLGLNVDDMVKVTAEGKFFNEDGIVRRLKNGQIFVRFYTYGTMFEEWLDPNDVRKLTGEEILRGLSGASQPITQEDLDGSNRGGGGGYNRDRSGGRNNFRNNNDNFQPFGGNNFGNNSRNRRQDRVANRFRNEQGPTGEENWNWYKEQRDRYGNINGRNQRGGFDAYERRDGGGYGQGRGNDRFGGQRRNDGWNGGGQRRNDGWNERGGQRRNDGWNDGGGQRRNGGYQQNSRQGYERGPRQGGREYRDGDQTFRPGSRDWDDRNDNDFGGGGGWKSQRQTRRESNRVRDNFDNRRNEAAIDGKDDWSAFVSKPPRDPVASEGDDFFSSLITDLKKGLDDNPGESDGSKPNPKPNKEDDFFASLLSELEEDAGMTTKRSRRKRNEAVEVKQDDDFFSSLDAQLSDTSPAPLASDDDFFESLESDLQDVLSRTDDNKPTKGEKPLRNDGSVESDLLSTPSTLDKEATPEVEPSPSAEIVEGGWTAVPVESDAPEKATTKSPKAQPPRQKPQQESSTPTMNEIDLTSRTVPVLKDMLRERGLKVGGKKADLIERLMQSS